MIMMPNSTICYGYYINTLQWLQCQSVQYAMVTISTPSNDHDVKVYNMLWLLYQHPQMIMMSKCTICYGYYINTFQWLQCQSVQYAIVTIATPSNDHDAKVYNMLWLLNQHHPMIVMLVHNMSCYGCNSNTLIWSWCQSVQYAMVTIATLPNDHDVKVYYMLWLL